MTFGFLIHEHTFPALPPHVFFISEPMFMSYSRSNSVRVISRDFKKIGGKVK